MPKPNYAYEKRQREAAKKEKKAEKRERKVPTNETGSSPEDSPAPRPDAG
jgi:hypothetical protein